MVEIPYYLRSKLIKLGIENLLQLKKFDYLKVYKWLRDIYPSLNYRGLFDLYCLVNDIKIGELAKELKQEILHQFKNLLPTYIPLNVDIINIGLSKAQAQAQIADKINEVPVGAVVYHNNKIISVGYNQTLATSNIMSHAEIVAISRAQSILGNYRLKDCDLYVTLEPCLMCAGAIINSRIRRVIFGAVEPKTGAVMSQFKVFDNLEFNHTTEAIGPIDNTRYSVLIKDFFLKRRL